MHNNSILLCFTEYPGICKQILVKAIKFQEFARMVIFLWNEGIGNILFTLTIILFTKYYNIIKCFTYLTFICLTTRSRGVICDYMTAMQFFINLYVYLFMKTLINYFEYTSHFKIYIYNSKFTYIFKKNFI